MAGWVRVDTRFISHPKVLDVGPLGEALWLRGLCYAGEQLTDGFVPATFLKRMADMKAFVVAAKLVAAGLWTEVEGGYEIHDYLEWQRSRDEASDLSSKRADAGRLGGKQKASNMLANAKQNPSNMSSKNLADKNREDKSRDREDIPPKPPEGVKPPPHRIPDDFQVDDNLRAWAIEKGFTPPEIAHHTEAFIAHWRAEATAKARKLDWGSAWRTWLMREKPGRWPGSFGSAPRPRLPPGVDWRDVDEWRNRLRGGYPLSDEKRQILTMIDGSAAA